MSLVFYVSGHGFGHATRVAAVLGALRLRRDGLSISVRSTAPAWLFRAADPEARCSPAWFDVGMVQTNGLDIDFAATLREHGRLARAWDRRAEEEALFLRRAGARLVVGDIPPLACAAAARAGVLCLALGNFSWDWILGRYARAEPRWRPFSERYAAAYASAAELLRLPLAAPMPAFRRATDVPLLVRRSGLSRERARRLLGIAPRERRKVVLLSFGGFGSGPLDLADGDDLRDFLFVGFGPKPAGLRAAWLGLPRQAPRHMDLLAACDAALSKPGYGMVAECLAHRRPLLYLPRPDFPETPVLERELRRLGVGRRLARPDFSAGRWRAGLEALLAAPRRWAPLRTDGADVVAERLLRGL